MSRSIIFSLLLTLSLLIPLTSAHAWYPLNDTGIQFCGEATSGNNDPCTGGEPHGQDAHHGRDAAARAGTLTKVGAGEAGFDFTKISNSGQALSATAQLGSGPNDWACTRDNVTGLLWEVKVDDVTHLRHKDHRYTWYFTNSPDGNPGSTGNTWSCRNTLDGQNCNTENYAAKVNTTGLCGFTDWRVPTIKELESIAHQGRTNPAIDTGYFPNTASSDFWSASPVWSVHFSGGYSSGYSYQSSYSYRVRLVHGGHWLDPLERADFCKDNFTPSNPDSAYTDHGDGTVTDVRTGITWKRCSEGQTWDGSTCTGVASGFNWAVALQIAESASFAGHSDWRLPNVKELRSIVEECRSTAPKINPNIFPETPNHRFWWSSSPAGNPDTSWGRAWFVDFSTGYPGNLMYRGYAYLVRLARGGQWFGPSGGLTVTIEPAAVRSAGAQWRRVGAVTWRDSGATESDVPVGMHTVEFKDVDGWTTPDNLTVTVEQNETATATGTYTAATYTVTPSAGDGGSIEPDIPQTINHGDTITFTVTPDDGYTPSMGGTCGGILDGDTFTTDPITDDCTVKVRFFIISRMSLNDTGIQFCGEATRGNNDPCTGSEPQGQDAHHGRDAAAKAGTLTKVGAGEAGFDFTKISNSGQALPTTAQIGSGPNDWACTLDNVTGIMWEVKVDDPAQLRHKDHTYTWYYTDSPDGNPGAVGNTTSCSDTLDGENCNTENYAAKVNSAGLCGFTDWRVPNIRELEGIANQGRWNPAINTDYFPNTAGSGFWSSSPYAYLSNIAWSVHFGYGYSSNAYYDRSSYNRVRLARGGQCLAMYMTKV